MSSKRSEYNAKNKKTCNNIPGDAKTNKETWKTMHKSTSLKPKEISATKTGPVNKLTTVTSNAKDVNGKEISLSVDGNNEALSISKPTDNEGFTQVVSRREIAKTKKIFLQETVEDANLSKKQRRANFFRNRQARKSADINNKPLEDKISKSPKEKISMLPKDNISKSPTANISKPSKEKISRSPKEKISKSKKEKISKSSKENKPISKEKQLLKNPKLLVDEKDVLTPKLLPNINTTVSYSSALKLDSTASNHIPKLDGQTRDLNKNIPSVNKSAIKLSTICKRDQCTQTYPEEFNRSISPSKTKPLPFDCGAEIKYVSKSTSTTDTTANKQVSVQTKPVTLETKPSLKIKPNDIPGPVLKDNEGSTDEVTCKRPIEVQKITNQGKKTAKSDRKRFRPAKENKSKPIDLITFIGYKKKKPERRGRKTEENSKLACKEKSLKPLPRIDNFNFPSLSSSINLDISKKSKKLRAQIIKNEGSLSADNTLKTVRHKTNSLSDSENESHPNILIEQDNFKYGTNLKVIEAKQKRDGQSINVCPIPRIRKSHIHKQIHRRGKMNFARPIIPDLPTEKIDETPKVPDWREPVDWNDLLESDDELGLDILLHSFPIFNSHNDDQNIEVPAEQVPKLFKEKNVELCITPELIQVCLPAKQDPLNSETLEPCGVPEPTNNSNFNIDSFTQSETKNDIPGIKPKRKRKRKKNKAKTEVKANINKRQNIEILQSSGLSLTNLNLTDDNDEEELFSEDFYPMQDFENGFASKPIRNCMNQEEAYEYMEGDHTGYFNCRGYGTPSTEYQNHGSANCVLKTLERIEKVLELMLIQAYKTTECIPDEFGNQTIPQAVKKAMSEVNEALEPIKNFFIVGESDEPYKLTMNAIHESIEPVFNHLNDQRLVLQSPATYYNYICNDHLKKLLLGIQQKKDANALLRQKDHSLPKYIQDLIFPIRSRRLKHVELNLDVVMNDLVKQEMRITKSETVTPVILERAQILLKHYMNQVTRYYINHNLPPPYPNTVMTNRQKHNARVTPNGLIEFRFFQNMHVFLTVDLGIIVINKEDKMLAAISADGEFCGIKYKYGECAISETGNVIDANVKRFKDGRCEIVRQIKLDNRGLSFHVDQSLYTFMLTKNGICTTEFDFCEFDEDFLGKFFVSNSCIGPKFVKDCICTLNGAKCEVYPDRTCIWYIQNVKICQFSSGQISVLRNNNTHTVTMWPPHISLRYPPNSLVYSGRIKTLDINVTASATTSKRNRKNHLFLKKGNETQAYSNDCTFELRNTNLYAGVNLKTGNIYVRTQET